MNISNLKQKRKELGLTQWDLAKKIGVSPTTIRSWENGVVEPRENNLKKLKAVLEDGQED